MCNRINQIDNERRSVQTRLNFENQLLETEEDENIYKTQDHKKQIIQTKSNKNKDKQEIIKQLNQKINSMFKNSSKERNQDLNIKVDSASSKQTYINLNLESKPTVLINDPETVSSIATRGMQLPTKKSHLESKFGRKPRSKEFHARNKGSIQVRLSNNSIACWIGPILSKYEHS